MATPPMATPPRIHLYAELLQNIRQVSVSALFSFAGDTSPSAFAAAVRAEVLPDGVTLCVRSNASVDGPTLLTLPGRVAAGGSRLPVTQGRPVAGKGDDQHSWHVSWRLPLAAPAAAAAAAAASAEDRNPVPWSAPDLEPGVPVACRACSAALVPAGRLRTWKDLPSENWAEMMEFWHCHKPDHRENGTEDSGNGRAGDAALAGRGYGANTGIAAEPGVGFVDVNAFLVSETDCQGILYSEATFEEATETRQSLVSASKASRPLRTLRVFCSKCHAHVGYFHDRMQAVNLFKWAVSLVPDSNGPAVSDCLAATLTTMVARTGSSKTVVMSTDMGEGQQQVSGVPQTILHIWILNGNISYVSSGRDAAPVPAIKLLYKEIGRREADDLLERLNSDVQETNFPSDEIRLIHSLLDQSNALLPSTERLFKEWKIGLLPRWSEPASSKT